MTLDEKRQLIRDRQATGTQVGDMSVERKRQLIRERQQAKVEETKRIEDAIAKQAATGSLGIGGKIPESEYSLGGERLRALNSGALFDFADEIEAAVSATVGSIFHDKLWMEEYDKTWGELSESRKAYEKERFGEALALNLAGGVATGKLGITSIPKVAQSIKAAPRLVKFSAPLVESALEGAVAGIGASGQGDESTGAGIGAGAGIGFNLFGKSLKGSANMLTKRKVRQKLGSGEDFVPINIAADGTTLGDTYRSFFGQAFGSKIPEQSRVAIARKSEPIERKIQAAVADTNSLNIENKENIRALKRTIGEVGAGEQKVIKRTKQVADEAEKVKLTRAIQQAKNEAAQGASVSQQKFRENIVKKSIPPSATPEQRAAIMALDTPQKQLSEIRKLNSAQGFTSVKKLMLEKFNIDSVKKQIDKLIKDGGYELTEKEVLQSIKRRLTGKGKAGNITGVDAMAARNELAMFANRINPQTGTPNRHRAALRDASQVIDDEIVKSLGRRKDGAERKALYAAEKLAYGNQRALGDAVEKAGGLSKGRFTPEEYLGAQNKYNVGTGGKNQQEVLDTVGEVDAEKQAALLKMAKAKDIEKAQRSATADTAMSGLEESRRLTKDANEAVIQNTTPTLREIDVDPNYDKNIADLKRLERSAPTDGGIFPKLASTTILGGGGAALGSLVGMPVVGGMASGTLAAKLLTSEAAQRAVAGQTPAQRQLAATLRKYRYAGDNIGRGVRRGSLTGTMSEQEY